MSSYELSMFGIPLESVDAGGNTIINVSAPVNTTDAANADYVDTQIRTKDEVHEIINYCSDNNIDKRTLDNIINSGSTGIIVGCVPSVVGSLIVVSDGYALLRSTNSESGTMYIVKFDSQQISTAEEDNYISLNFNVNGGVLSLNTPNNNNIIEICRVNNNVGDLTITSVYPSLPNSVQKLYQKIEDSILSGPTGATGEQGLPGYPGNNGLPGDPGPQGPTGPTGTFNSSELDNYAYLPGRAGGQTINGGINASDNLTLSSTSNATKGRIDCVGAVWPSLDNSYNLGQTSKRWGIIYGMVGSFTNSLSVPLVSSASINGGSTSGGNLSLDSTSNATKGKIISSSSIEPLSDGALSIGAAGKRFNASLYTVTVDNTLTAPTIRGSTSSGGNLNLSSTSNATKGSIIISSNTVPQANNTYDLGSSGGKWKDIHATNVICDTLTTSSYIPENINTNYIINNWESFEDDFKGTTLNSAWATEVSSGTCTLPTTAGEYSTAKLTLTDVGGYVRLHGGSYYHYFPKTNSMIFETRFKIGTSTTTARIGLRSATEYIAFDFDSTWVGGDNDVNNWLVTYEGDVSNQRVECSTPLVAVKNTYMYFRIESNTTNIFLYYRTSYSNSWTTAGSVLTSAFSETDFQPYIHIDITNASTMNIDYVKLIQDRE